MSTPAPLEFHYDFSSPYGYLAAQKIGALAARHGRTVEWNPILLGVVFRQTGTAPLTEIPLKGEYSKRDFARSARFHGLPPFRMPSRQRSRSIAPTSRTTSTSRRPTTPSPPRRVLASTRALLVRPSNRRT